MSTNKASVRVVAADLADDPCICQIAKQHRHTKDFAGILFIRRSVESLYNGGSVLKAELDGHIVGFCCVKHLVRKPYSSVYYMGTRAGFERRGISTALIHAALKASPWNRIELICEEANAGAMQFYLALGFKELGRGQLGKTHPRPYRRLFLGQQTTGLFT